MDIINNINNICEKDTTVYGYAKMENVKNYLNNTFPKFICEYPYAISIGISIPDDIIDTIYLPKLEEKYLQTNKNINNKLDEVCLKIENLIKNNNYKAKAIPSSNIISKDKLIGDISHKLVANLSGLGWIGKSCLLINPYYGPRIRWATILTNLPLPYSTKQVDNKCKTCRLCAINCPSNAIKNIKFRKEDSRDIRYDAYKCNKYFKELESEGRSRLCGLCIKVCPWGLVNKKSRK